MNENEEAKNWPMFAVAVAYGLIMIAHDHSVVGAAYGLAHVAIFGTLIGIELVNSRK